MAEETILLERARGGDIDAFGELVEQTRERVYMTALQLTGSHADADELSQQAFLRAFQSLDKFRGDSAFFTWMYRITVNLCLTHLKTRSRFQPLPEPGEDETSLREFGTSEPPEHSLELSDEQKRVRQALDQLGPELRAAAVLVYLQDLSPREASRALSCAEATIHWRLFKARKILKRILS